MRATENQACIFSQNSDLCSDMDRCGKLRRGGGDPKRFIVRSVHVLSQREYVVLNSGQIQNAHVVARCLESGGHLQKPQANEHAFVEQEARGRLDQANAHCISASTGLTAKLSMGLRRIGSASNRFS